MRGADHNIRTPARYGVAAMMGAMVESAPTDMKRLAPNAAMVNRPVFLGQWIEYIHAAAPVPRRS